MKCIIIFGSERSAGRGCVIQENCGSVGPASHFVTHALCLDVSWSCCRLQEDAEALRRHAGQTRSGAHPVRAHHRERRHRAAVRPRRGTKATLWEGLWN